MRFMIRILLLIGLGFFGNWNIGYADDATEQQEADEKRNRAFAASGRERGNADAYNYLFNEEFDDAAVAAGKTAAAQAFSVPTGYQLLTRRDDEATTALRYGDLVKIWHLGTNGYLHSHNIKYYHPDSSKQNQVTIFMGQDRADSDKSAVWWRIVGPDGNDDDKLAGEPIDTSKPIRLLAVSVKGASFSLGDGKYALHSHSYLQYKHPSPVREEDFEEKGEQGTLKQEVTTFNKDGAENNWNFMKSSQAGEREECGLGTRFSLQHSASQQFLRGKEGITFDVRKGLNVLKSFFKKDFTQNDSTEFMQLEASCVAQRNNPETTFKIALVARKTNMIGTLLKQLASQGMAKATALLAAKSFAQNYVSQFNDGLYTITVSKGDEPRLLCQAGKSLHANGIMPSSSSDKRMNEMVEFRTLFKIKTDKNAGVLGIQAANNSDFNGNMLQQDKDGDSWKSGLVFKNDNFENNERWVPVDASNGEVYLKNVGSGNFIDIKLASRKINFGNEDSRTINENSSSMVTRNILAVDDSIHSRRARFTFTPFIDNK